MGVLRAGITPDGHWLRRRGQAALLLFIVGALTACSGRGQPPNVIIVLVDTFRPDTLGAYGGPRGLTPTLDALADRGTVFRKAYAQSSWTNPSVASLFTSRFQHQHGVISFGSPLGEEEVTLAERLKARGYETAAFLATILLQERLGFAQGFDTWRIVARHDTAAPPGTLGLLKGTGAELNDATFAWLDQRADPTTPLMLYIHYMEPHAPYDPPQAFMPQHSDAHIPDRAAVNRFMNVPTLPMPDALVADAERLYDAEVAHVDWIIGQLLDGLRSRGLLDDTIIVVVGDHGEEFKEHGLVGHHQTLYEEVIRVPLIIAATAHPATRSVAQVTSLIDVAPTIVELIGDPTPPAFEGRSYARMIGAPPWWSALVSGADAVPPPVPALSELIKADGILRLSPHERAVVTDTAKVIVGVKGERAYFDLSHDPGEQHPEAPLDSTRRTLDHALEVLADRPALAHQPTIDADTRERMRALGYTE